MRTAGEGLHSVPASILSLMRAGLHEHQVLIRVSENRHSNCSIEQTIYRAAKSSPLVIDYEKTSQTSLNHLLNSISLELHTGNIREDGR